MKGKFGMGIRVIKTAAAVFAAITLSQLLGLQSPLSTGLLAILGIDVTKKRGLQTSFQRLVASIGGLLLAVLLFWLFGFHIWVISLYILILYPLLNRFQLKEGVVTGSVVMFHVYLAERLTTDVILNEIALLVVGLGTASVINIIYMPSEDKRLVGMKEQLEQLFSRIFVEISKHLKDNGYIWSGTELLEAENLLEEALALVRRSNENMLFREETAWAAYFYMRKQQLESIERMMQLVAQVYQTLHHGELLSGVFIELSEDVKGEYYTGRAEQEIAALENRFRRMKLPESREEFEIRSALLQLMMELKAFVAVAKREKKQKETGISNPVPPSSHP
ncbi:aromatic acid exporter family protein [Paenibacillus rigui]|nr:aromatic acid exporter family protein [Paenibacillus rigui]